MAATVKEGFIYMSMDNGVAWTAKVNAGIREWRLIASTPDFNKLAAAVANGNVRLVRGKWITDWLDEVSSFPEACTHDDQVDSAVGAFTFLTGLGLPQRRKAVIIV
jgi:phage terminase large subunit-like protein